MKYFKYTIILFLFAFKASANEYEYRLEGGTLSVVGTFITSDNSLTIIREQDVIYNKFSIIKDGVALHTFDTVNGTFDGDSISASMDFEYIVGDSKFNPYNSQTYDYEFVMSISGTDIWFAGLKSGRGEEIDVDIYATDGIGDYYGSFPTVTLISDKSSIGSDGGGQDSYEIGGEWGGLFNSECQTLESIVFENSTNEYVTIDIMVAGYGLNSDGQDTNKSTFGIDIVGATNKTISSNGSYRFHAQKQDFDLLFYDDDCDVSNGKVSSYTLSVKKGSDKQTKIYGTVKNLSGDDMEGWLVSVYDIRWNWIASSLTDVEGEYEIYTHPMQYFIKAQKGRVNTYNTRPKRKASSYTVTNIARKSLKVDENIPNISSVSGTFGKKNSITITGENFGTKKGYIDFTGYLTNSKNYAVTWTDTEIQAVIPSLAISGCLRIFNKYSGYSNCFDF